MTPADQISRLRGLEPHLAARIRGQDHLLPRLSAALCRGALGMTSPQRPRASLLLVGPTGTGKTESLTCAVEYIFGSSRLLAFDMSEYQEQSSIAKFIGADRSDPGLLGRALLQHEEGALLFDEIDKAHPQLMDLFLQMLWDGRITVATGQAFRLDRFFIAFTANIGAADSVRMAHSAQAGIEQATLRRLEQVLRPEFLGRIDEKLVFARLDPDVQREICALEIRRETERLRGIGYDLSVSGEAMEFLLQEGFHPRLGARPLRKAVERHLQDAVVRSLFDYGLGGGIVSVDNTARRLIIRSAH